MSLAKERNDFNSGEVKNDLEINLEDILPAYYSELEDSPSFEHIDDDYSKSSLVSAELYDRVVKRLSDDNQGSRFLGLLREYNGEGELSENERANNIKNSRKLEDIDAFGIPEVIREEDGVIELERIDGDELYSFMDEVTSEEAFDLGRDFGQRLKLAHENDLALRDLNKGNFIREENPLSGSEEIFYVDAEYFRENASLLDKKWDLLVFNAGISQYLSENYNEVINGFSKGYNVSDTEMRLYSALKTIDDLVF